MQDLHQNLIAALGVQDLPEEQRLAIVDQAAALVEKRIFVRLMDSLPEEAVAEAEKLADKPEELLKFLAAQGPGIETVFAEETAKVVEELSAAAKE
jgi:Protein of unknown function (DUF5663)